MALSSVHKCVWGRGEGGQGKCEMDRRDEGWEGTKHFFYFSI